MATNIRSYRDLEVWQEAMNLVEMIYPLTDNFPSSELFGLTSQMRRASVSIPSNIAEGQARKGSREFSKHLSIARGSLAELETQLILSVRLKFVTKDDAAPIWTQMESVGKLMTALVKSLPK